MKKMLYIQSSPREEMSYSKAVADVFVEDYRQNHPEDKIKILDLFRLRLPPFDGDVLQAKYAILHGKQHTDGQRKAWEQVEKLIEQFKKADKYLFSIPMWNFGIPYKLKHYIDVITQPGYTFSYSAEEGYKGLVTGKPAICVYARGGEYTPGTPGEIHDFQKRYFEHLLGFIGFTDIKSVFVQGTLYGPEVAEKAKSAAIEEVRKIALNF